MSLGGTPGVPGGFRGLLGCGQAAQVRLGVASGAI